MIPVRQVDRVAAFLALGCLGLACQGDPQPKRAPPAAYAAASASPASASAASASAAPTAAADPVRAPQEASAAAASTPPAADLRRSPRTSLQLGVSEVASDDPGKQLLVGYERLGRSRNLQRVDISTDRNAVEFPASVTSARIRGVAVPADTGAGKGRAMSLKLRLREQWAEFAACIGNPTCGCEGVIPYAYISLGQELPAEPRLDAFKTLSFWAKSKEPFELHMVLSCYVEPRPKSTVAPNNGYLDEAHTKMDPCWQSPRVELPLSDPIEILGDDMWHRYQVPIADLKPSAPVKVNGAGQMVCSLDKVTHVAYVLKKSQPPEPGEYPQDEGEILFDDLEGLTLP